MTEEQAQAIYKKDGLHHFPDYRFVCKYCGETWDDWYRVSSYNKPDICLESPIAKMLFPPVVETKHGRMLIVTEETT